MNHGLFLNGRFYFQRPVTFPVIGDVWSNWKVVPNGITNAAINDLLDVQFRNQTQRPNWYIGLIRDDNFTGVAAADTMASHAGWEEGDEYDEATRPEWTPPVAANQELINSTVVEFTINAAQTFKGFFLSSDNTKGGTTGILWCTALFDDDQVMPAGEKLKAIYELKGREG